jgi:hypothetical protein
MLRVKFPHTKYVDDLYIGGMELNIYQVAETTDFSPQKEAISIS